jgi:hypothetical protein
VRYATPADFRKALEHRLLSSARHSGAPVSRLRKLVLFDRLLARLLIVAPDRWILKGALALDFRMPEHARSTRDMDLAYHHDEEVATADFIAAQSAELGDYFTFIVERTTKLDAVLPSIAVRYHVVALLAGRVFDEAIVDVGLDNPLVSPPEELHGHDLLGFAEIAPILVPVLPLEQHVAEKIHAYARIYVGGRQSTRVKDLIDLVIIQAHAELNGDRLREALVLVFDKRGSGRPPPELAAPPTHWTVPYQAMATAVGIDTDITTGFQLSARFLNPVLARTVPHGARWSPILGRWTQQS